MNPLDTKAVPRQRDVVRVAAHDLAHDHGHGHGHDHGDGHAHDHAHTYSPDPAKLSAELHGRPDPATSLLYAVDAEGGLFTLTGTGQHQRLDFDADWLAMQVSVSARGNDVWVLAKRRPPPAGDAAAGSEFGVWRRSADGWELFHRTTAAGSRPVIGGGDDGCWIACDGVLTRLGGGAWRDEEIGFDPIGISEGRDGTLWLLGGAKRYGGLEVRRWDDDQERWFLLPPPAAAISIAGAPDGSAWSVSTKGEAWRLSRDGAGTFRECGLDADCRRCFYKPDRSFVRAVSAGSDGNIWFLSGTMDGNGFQIERMTDVETRESETPAPSLGAISIAAATL